MPRIEVRFQDLTADANVNVGSAGMPSFINFFRNSVIDTLSALRLTPGGRQALSILGGVKGVLKPVGGCQIRGGISCQGCFLDGTIPVELAFSIWPALRLRDGSEQGESALIPELSLSHGHCMHSQGRFTLLLGPPSSGKSTLLKSLSGAVKNGEDGLRMKGSITYNGETLDKFQPRRTAAYVDEVDLHMAELTVRETFDFAARCFGAGETPGLCVIRTFRAVCSYTRPSPSLTPLTLVPRRSMRS